MKKEKGRGGTGMIEENKNEGAERGTVDSTST
jgi:hypothetical protein